MPSLPPISKRFGLSACVLALLLPALAGCLSSGSSDSALAALDALVAREAAGAEQGGDFAAAARHYASLYQSNPSDLAVIEGLARNQRHAGNFAEAISTLDEALARLGPQGRLLVEKGKVEIALGNAALAVTTLRAAIALAPRDWEGPATLAIALDRLGLFDEAEAQYRVALGLDANNNAEIYNNYALSRALAGRIDEAKALLRTAVTLPNATVRVRENLVFLENLGAPAPATPVKPVRHVRPVRHAKPGRVVVAPPLPPPLRRSGEPH